MMRFDRFTERAQDAAARAYEVLQRYGHTQVDTEHVLLALLEQPGGRVSQILDHLKVDGAALRRRLEEALPTLPIGGKIYSEHPGQVFITPRVKQTIDLANEEANRLKDEYISTEHIFLAILSERNTAVARILMEAGVTREQADEIVKGAMQSHTPVNGSKTVRLSLDLPLAKVLDLVEQLPLEDARQIYERLKQRLETKD